MADLHQIIRAVFGVSKHRFRGHVPVLVKHPRERLGMVYRDAGFTMGAEIGVKRGEYAEATCKASPTLHYHCVDIWDTVPDRYQFRRRRHLREARVRLAPYHATFIRGKSLDAVCDFADQSLDFVYIDAAHDFDNVVQDIIQWSAKVKHGGVIAGHDYYQHRYGGVVPAVDAYVRAHQIATWYVTYEVMPSFFWVNP